MKKLSWVIFIVAALCVQSGCGDDTEDAGGSAEGGATNNAVNNTTNNTVNNTTNNTTNNTVNNTPNNEGPVCGDGECDEGESFEDCPDDCEAPGPVCGDGECDEGESFEDCPDDCEAPSVCTPGESRCVDLNTVEVCNDAGTALETSPCPVGEICDEESGRCSEVTCRPGAVLTCASQTSIFLCNETGTGRVEQDCEPGFFCDFVAGEFLCTNQVCEPGTTRCAGETGTETCDEQGLTWVLNDLCVEGTRCDEGSCKSLCEINSKVSSFLGCEYWSADLDNIEGGTNAAHAVIISNPTDIPATVEVFDGQGNPVVVNEWPTTVEPGQLQTWVFQGSYINQTDNSQLINMSLIDGTTLVDQTFQFISSVPVTAHQFNPLVDRNVFTNDASLLLPTNAIGTDYLVMSWKHRTTPVIRGFATAIAVGTEPTTITVTPTATVVAGQDRLNNTPIARIASGESREFVLQPGQLLNLETEGPLEADLTGTRITSDFPIVVFGGHECANVPTPSINFCDHIEQQMFPTNSWGTEYVGTDFVDRDPNRSQSEVWRILARDDQTTLTTIPAIPNVDGVILNSGEFVEFSTDAPFELEATAPVLVGQYMTGSASTGGNSIGDPAFTLASPIEQWRRDYIVLTPQAYNRGDYLNIIAPVGAEVILDDLPVDPMAFEPFGDGAYVVARVPVEDGPHTLSSDEPFTVIPYGYDSAVSYAYPGGLNLENLEQ